MSHIKQSFQERFLLRKRFVLFLGVQIIFGSLLWFYAAGTAFAQIFKVEARTDRLTHETFLEAKGLKVCQVKEAGFAAKCALLSIQWSPQDKDFVTVKVEIPEVASILKLIVRFDGKLETFDSLEQLSTHQIASQYSLDTVSTANTFRLPLMILKHLSGGPDSGLIRVMGVNSQYDLDFFRKAKMRGVPADELKQFLHSLAGNSQTAK